MGNTDNFCDCKNITSTEETNLSKIDDIIYMFCPQKTLQSHKKNDFTFNSNNSNLSINDHRRKAAVNKIIKTYREYKQNTDKNINKNGENTIEKQMNGQFTQNAFCSFEKEDNQIKRKFTLTHNKNENKLKSNIRNNNDFFNLCKNKNQNQIKAIDTKYNNSENIEISENNDENNYNKKLIFGQTKNSSTDKSISYLGVKIKGSKEGFGINIWDEDTKYIGYYKNNKANGYGKFIAGKDIYKGEFENDGACGFGIFNNGDETTMESKNGKIIQYILENIQEEKNME